MLVGRDTDLDQTQLDVIGALMRLEIADAEFRVRLRERLDLNATDEAAVQYIDRATDAGHRVHAKDLGTVLGISPAASTLVVNRLVAAGHVTRQPNPDNGRFRMLVLTPATEALLGEVVGPTHTVLRDVVTSLSVRDRKRAVAAIDAVSAALRDGAPTRDPDAGAGAGDDDGTVDA